MRKAILFLAITILMAGAAITIVKTPSSNPDALRQIVQGQCIVNWRASHNPTPCVRLSLSDPGNKATGFAVLPDQKEGAHYLLIPTSTLSGIESATLLAPHAPNYFNDAWQARDFIESRIGHRVPRAVIGLAINSKRSRSQNQLHINIECVSASTYETLHSNTERFQDHWSTIGLHHSTYLAMRVMGMDLSQANPFQLLADQVPDAKNAMGDYTLIVVGMNYEAGPGFVLLTGRKVPTGELLLDPTCKVAQ